MQKLEKFTGRRSAATALFVFRLTKSRKQRTADIRTGFVRGLSDCYRSADIAVPALNVIASSNASGIRNEVFDSSLYNISSNTTMIMHNTTVTSVSLAE
jgi:hypothetical protein